MVPANTSAVNTPCFKAMRKSFEHAPSLKAPIDLATPAIAICYVLHEAAAHGTFGGGQNRGFIPHSAV